MALNRNQWISFNSHFNLLFHFLTTTKYHIHLASKVFLKTSPLVRVSTNSDEILSNTQVRRCQKGQRQGRCGRIVQSIDTEPCQSVNKNSHQRTILLVMNQIPPFQFLNFKLLITSTGIERNKISGLSAL